jgi:hypothetical protein
MYYLFGGLLYKQCLPIALEAVKGRFMARGYISPLLQIPTNRTRTATPILITPINKVNKKMMYMEQIYDAGQNGPDFIIIHSELSLGD